MKQVPTRIKGLDEILEGGFNRPSIVMVAGTAGTGKTTLVLQSLFNAAREEEVCMYITALSEPPSLVSSFMSKFDFYDPEILEGENFKYISLERNLLGSGSSAVVKQIRENIEEVKPDRIALDPVNVLTQGLEERKARVFYYDLFTDLRSWNSLVLVTGEFSEEDLAHSSLSYTVDGIIYLTSEIEGGRRVRYLDVLKMRGQNYETGKHTYRITREGIVTYPLLRLKKGEKALVSGERVETGVPGLDAVTGGGFQRGTSILYAGGSGTGKTLLGLQFLIDGAKKGEPGVILTFEGQLKSNALCFGWNLEELERKGLFRIIQARLDDLDVNHYAQLLSQAVEELGARRVLLDGICSFKSIFTRPLQLREHVQGLSDYLKSKGVTTVFTTDTQALLGPLAVSDVIYTVMDTIIILSYVELAGSMKKALAVLKMRGSDHAKEIRELVIGSDGVKLKGAFTGYSGIMSGSPRRAQPEAFVEAFRK